MLTVQTLPYWAALFVSVVNVWPGRRQGAPNLTTPSMHAVQG